MTVEKDQAFVNQVIEAIKKHKASENYHYYSDFINECNTYGLTEEDFNKRILRIAFKSINPEKLNLEPTSGPHCIIFGIKAYSLRKVGEIFFNHPSMCEEYMTDATLFREDIRKLENSDKTLELVKVFKSEDVFYRRYLRTTYHLNRTLPFRFGTELVKDLKELLIKGFRNYDLYGQIVQEYMQERLGIWLEETDPENATKLDNGLNYEDFLRFIYRVDKTYPFYVNDELFLKPLDLVTKAHMDLSFAAPLHQHLLNGYIGIWLDSIGKAEWNQEYQINRKMVDNSSYHNEEEKKLAAIQLFIDTINPSIGTPKINSDIKNITLLEIQADRTHIQRIRLKLAHKGFVKFTIALNENITGISVGPAEAIFYDLNGNTENEIIIEIDPSQLVRNKTYNCSIIVTSIYEVLEIPVEVKVVFPIRAFVLEVFKYATLFALFFASIRFLIAREYSNWLMDSFDYFLDWESAQRYPENFSLFGWLFLLLLLSIASGSYFLFKRHLKDEHR